MSRPKQKKSLNIKKFWPLVSILLFLSIIATPILWPQISRPLAWTALCLGLGLAIYATVHRDHQPYQQGLIPRRALVRALVIDLSGLLLSTAAAGNSLRVREGAPNFMTDYGDLGFHGAYWHDDFGSPVSHGCINLSPADARWLYEWAWLGERVIISAGE
jgi:hypothetical protein